MILARRSPMATLLATLVLLPALPATFEDEPRAELTPEQQVEAIRRRIEARRAMRAQEGAEERAALERNKQVQ